MTPHSFLRRRPSAALLVSFLALFVSLGGAGWAALRLPPRSVGNAQLQNFSVGNAKLRPNAVGASKIIPGSIGARQVNSSQVQLRVTSSCPFGAIQSLSPAGNVTCTPALPSEYGTLPQQATLGVAPTQVATVSLPTTPGGSSYLAIGNVQIAEAEGTAPQSVHVTCSMALAGATGTQGEFDADLGAGHAATAAGTIPLVLPIAFVGSPHTVLIECSNLAVPATPAPRVSVTATLHAVQTAVNNDS